MSHLLHLRTFLSVYRYNSVSRAADVLHLTQPAVSRHIKLLESHLGQQLFERLPRGLAPTPAAHELERQAGPALDTLEGLLRTPIGSEAVGGLVNLGTTSSFDTLLLAGLNTLPQQGIRLNLQTAPPTSLLTLLVEAQLDVVVTLARIPHKGVEYEVLYEGDVLLVCAPAWRERLPKSAAPRGLPLIELQGPMPPLAAFWREAYGSKPELPSLMVPDYQSAMSAALAGSGLAVLPACLCAEALASGRLLVVPGTRRTSRLILYVAVRKGSDNIRHIDAMRQRLLELGRTWA